MKDIARWLVLIPLFIIPFLPLYVESSLFFPFIAGKGFAFRILVEIALGAYVLLALADKRYRPKWSWTLLIYGALVVWMFVADLFAVNPHKAFWSNYERMDGFVTLIHTFLFFVIAGSVLTVGNLWKKWWFTVLGASVLVGIHGLLQLGGAAAIHQGGVRLDANMGNAAYLAAYLLFIVAVAVWQAIESKGWLRYLLAALAVLHAILLISTATRGAILALVAGVLVAGILFSFQSGAKGRKIGIGVVLAGLIVIGGFFAIRDTAFVRQDPVLSRVASISLGELSTRFTLWGMAWEGIKERPVLGWGHEGYAYIFSKYYDPSLYAQEPWFDRAHGIFIDWLVYGGIPAFLLFVALVGYGILSILRAPLSKPERILLATAIVVYAIQGLVVFDNLMSYILFAAILAVTHSASARPVKSFDELPETDDARLTQVAAPALLVITLAGVWVVNAAGIAGGWALIDAAKAVQTPPVALAAYERATKSGSFATQEIREQLISYASAVVSAGNVAQDVKQTALNLAIPEMQKEIQRVPTDPRIRLMYAQAFEAAGDATSSLREVNAAVALSPRKQGILVQAGLDEWKAGNKEAARARFFEAYNLDTSFPELAAYAAAGDIITGDNLGAKQILTDAFGSPVVDNDVLRFAYAETKQYDDLIKSAQLAVENQGHSASSRFYLARVYATAGRVADARAEIQATIAAHPEASAEGQQYLQQLAGAQ